jgi:hypothetical protein
MMKRMVASLVLGCFVSNLSAMNIYNAMSNGVVNCGTLIENADNIPLIGKLTNILPFGMLATCCKEYPGQTMLLCAGVVAYILSKNETVTARFNIYKNNVLEKLGVSRKYNVTCDGTLFIFDGDDEDDAEEQIETEDELLAGEDFGDSEHKRNQQSLFVQPAHDTCKINFL